MNNVGCGVLCANRASRILSYAREDECSFHMNETGVQSTPYACLGVCVCVTVDRQLVSFVIFGGCEAVVPKRERPSVREVK